MRKVITQQFLEKLRKAPDTGTEDATSVILERIEELASGPRSGLTMFKTQVRVALIIEQMIQELDAEDFSRESGRCIGEMNRSRLISRLDFLWEEYAKYFPWELNEVEKQQRLNHTDGHAGAWRRWLLGK